MKPIINCNLNEIIPVFKIISDILTVARVPTEHTWEPVYSEDLKTFLSHELSQAHLNTRSILRISVIAHNTKLPSNPNDKIASCLFSARAGISPNQTNTITFVNYKINGSMMGISPLNHWASNMSHWSDTVSIFDRFKYRFNSSL